MILGDKVDAAFHLCMAMMEGPGPRTPRIADYLRSLMQDDSWTEGELYELQLKLIDALARELDAPFALYKRMRGGR